MKKKTKFSLGLLKFVGLGNTFKSFNYTVLAGFTIISIFFLMPKLLIFKNDLFTKSLEIKNESKNNLEKVLSGKKIQKEQEDELDSFQVFEDLFQYEEIPSSTVRLSASTIMQLFKDTNYNLKSVRKKKLLTL